MRRWRPREIFTVIDGFVFALSKNLTAQIHGRLYIKRHPVVKNGKRRQARQLIR